VSNPTRNTPGDPRTAWSAHATPFPHPRRVAPPTCVSIQFASTTVLSSENTPAWGFAFFAVAKRHKYVSGLLGSSDDREGILT
jgi:hypothetical protein